MLENIIWIMTGLIPTLATMEVAWRLATREPKTQRMTPANNDPIAKKEDVRAQQWTL